MAEGVQASICNVGQRSRGGDREVARHENRRDRIPFPQRTAGARPGRGDARLGGLEPELAEARGERLDHLTAEAAEKERRRDRDADARRGGAVNSAARIISWIGVIPAIGSFEKVPIRYARAPRSLPST